MADLRSALPLPRPRQLGSGPAVVEVGRRSTRAVPSKRRMAASSSQPSSCSDFEDKPVAPRHCGEAVLKPGAPRHCGEARRVFVQPVAPRHCREAGRCFFLETVAPRHCIDARRGLVQTPFRCAPTLRRGKTGLSNPVRPDIATLRWSGSTGPVQESCTPHSSPCAPTRQRAWTGASSNPLRPDIAERQDGGSWFSPDTAERQDGACSLCSLEPDIAER